MHGSDRPRTETLYLLGEGFFLRLPAVVASNTIGAVGIVTLSIVRRYFWFGFGTAWRFSLSFDSCGKTGVTRTYFAKTSGSYAFKMGVPALHQCLETFCFGMKFFRLLFTHLTPYWGRLEILEWFFVELPPVFTYHMCELCDAVSLWWVVAYVALPGA